MSFVRPGQRLVLASASTFRAGLLADAGIDVEAIPSTIDERAVEAAVGEADLRPEDIAQILAEAKASDVAERMEGATVIGADQVLELDGELLHKVESMEEARKRLLKLRGRTHRLHSAIVLASGSKVLWRTVESATLTMRDLSPEFIGRYLSAAGPDILKSVGLYQIEGLGMHLFDRIDGDHSTIIGLPLMPLIAKLRALDLIDG